MMLGYNADWFLCVRFGRFQTFSVEVNKTVIPQGKFQGKCQDNRKISNLITQLLLLHCDSFIHVYEKLARNKVFPMFFKFIINSSFLKTFT